jgi:hypothetical protein
MVSMRARGVHRVRMIAHRSAMDSRSSKRMWRMRRIDPGYAASTLGPGDNKAHGLEARSEDDEAEATSGSAPLTPRVERLLHEAVTSLRIVEQLHPAVLTGQSSKSSGGRRYEQRFEFFAVGGLVEPHGRVYARVQVPHPFETKAASPDRTSTTAGPVVLSFAAIERKPPPSALSRSQ